MLAASGNLIGPEQHEARSPRPASRRESIAEADAHRVLRLGILDYDFDSGYARQAARTFRIRSRHFCRPRYSSKPELHSNDNSCERHPSEKQMPLLVAKPWPDRLRAPQRWRQASSVRRSHNPSDPHRLPAGLTGPSSSTASASTRDGVAVKEINAAGGINGSRSS